MERTTQPGTHCNPGESVFEAADRLYGKTATVDTGGSIPTNHPDWERIGSVAVRPQESYPVFRIPYDVNPSLYK